jgi:hypothetical protein
MRSAWLKTLTILALLTSGASAQAGGWSQDWRYGFSVGYGGAGSSSSEVAKDGTTMKVDRSEGPLMFDLFVDRLLSDSLGLTFEHSRGISLAPFTSGASFTGLALKWYFLAPAPSMTAAAEGSSVLVKRFVPFAGIAAGVARVNIERDASDLVPIVSHTSAYTGIRLGADYQIAPGQGLRPQIVYSTSTFTDSFSTAPTPPTLSQFALQCGWYFNF